MSVIRKLLLIFLSAAFLCVTFLIALNSILNSHAIETPIKSRAELTKKPEKNNDLTPEVLEAIHELENTELNIFGSHNDYSIRFYRIDAHYPRTLRVHYYQPVNSANFLQYNDNIINYTDFNSIADFLYKNPEQDILVPLALLKPNYFLENAYFYRPDGFVFDVEMACHNTARYRPRSVYYSLDEKKIIGGTKIVRRRTKIDRPPAVESPPYLKTKP